MVSSKRALEILDDRILEMGSLIGHPVPAYTEGREPVEQTFVRDVGCSRDCSQQPNVVRRVVL